MKSTSTHTGNNPHIVILGGGFGGLTAARELAGSGARITLIDRENHHLFQPLLYQVATSALSAPEIAQPLRGILRDEKDVDVIMDAVRGIDLEGKTVQLSRVKISFDYLIVALGGRTNYFGHPEWEQHAPGLKSLADAHLIRNRLLGAFELAESSPEMTKRERQRLLTSVIIGAGPTGVEMAGAFAELSKRMLRRDFRHVDPRESRVVIVDAVDRVLNTFPEPLSRKAERQLKSLGVEIITGNMVQKVENRKVILEDREIEAENIVWTAGISANPVIDKLEVPKGRGGRLAVNPDCSVGEYSNVFGIGDIASLKDANDFPVPGVAPAAMQMARYVSKQIRRDLKSDPANASERKPFVYKDKGSLATIGRSRAVAQIGKLRLSGFPAWFTWLGVHLVFLIGMRNRLRVLLQWFFAYVRNKPGARVIWKSHQRRLPTDRRWTNRRQQPQRSHSTEKSSTK
jgi:NADH dehydrogenase